MSLLPDNVEYGIVSGQFLVPQTNATNSIPVTGSVIFTPSTDVLLDVSASPNPVAILKAPIVCTIDNNGYITDPSTNTTNVSLVATDNAFINPVGWTWHVSFDLKDNNGNRIHVMDDFDFLVPSNITTDLVSAVPVATEDGVLITRGEKGDTGDQGIQGETGPQGLRGGKWFYDEPATPDYGDVVGMIEGDLFLYQESRDFYQYRSGAWVYGGNIGTIKGDPGDLVPAVGGLTATGTVTIGDEMFPSTRRYVISSNTTFVLPTPSADSSGTLTFVFIQDATGGRTITWPASVKWPDGIVQQPSAAASSASMIHMIWTGNSWYGLLGGKSFA
jgi:hypothetical protein